MVMIIVPLAMLMMSMSSAMTGTAAFYTVPLAILCSLATFWIMMCLSKATRALLERRSHDRQLTPRLRGAQVFDLASLAEHNKHITKVRVIHGKTGDDIEVSTENGERTRVFEGLTPDESIAVVEALEA